MTGGSGPLKILYLEDDPRDEELLRHELERGGVVIDLHRIDRLEDLDRELAARPPDLVLADFRLQGFTAVSALDQVRRVDPDLPFILYSGAIGEEQAVDLLRRGASDYVLKDRPARLPEAMRAALRTAADRRAAREALELNRQIVESASVGITVYDRNLRYLAWNPAMEKMVGLKASEMLGKHPLDILPALKDMGLYSLMERALRGDVVQAEDVPFTSPLTGKPGWSSPRFSPLRNARGDIVGVIGIVRDVTERHLAEETTAEQARRLSSFLERISDGFVALDANWKYTYVNRSAAAAFGRTPEGMVGKHIWTEFPEGVGQKFQNAYERAFRDQVPLQIEEYYPPYDRWFENRIYPSPDGLSIFFTDVTDRKRLEDSIRVSEARYRTLFEQTPDGLFVMDPDGRCADANPAGCRLLGWTRDELLGKPGTEMVQPWEAPHVGPELESARRGGGFRREWTLRRKDGSAFESEVTIASLPGNLLLGIVRDITERKRAEEALKASEARLRGVFESPLIGILFWTADGSVSDANDEFLSIVGYNREDLRAGRINWLTMTPPEFVERDRRNLEELALHGSIPPFEKEYVRKDGRRVPVILGGARLGLSPLWGVAFAIDNSEARRFAKALEQSQEELRRLNEGLELRVRERTSELRDSEARFREFLESANDMVVFLTPEGRYDYVNRVWRESIGYTAEEARALQWQEVVAPEQVEGLRSRWLRILAGEDVGPIEVVKIAKDGRRIHTVGRLRCMTVDGKPTSIQGIFQDVTEQRRVEAALLKSEEDRIRLEEQAGSRHRFEGLVGKSATMQEVYRRLRMAAQSDVTVLLTGESGTGKELAAAAVHALSERKAKPFVAVNCSAIPEALLESELFGHVKGAFTGAVRDKTGLFQTAEGGTLFLDEVGDMPASLQVKVLRALQEHEIRRVGDEKAVKVDVRLVAATNRDLAALIAAGTMREDFYYRIHVFEISLPPLCRRKDDIPLLAAHFLKEMAGTQRKKARALSTDALRRLMDYSWPGNVRELRNALEHAMVTVKGDRIEEEDLPAEIRAGASALAPKPESSEERRTIVETLKKTGGNRSAAAKLLGISRVTLWKRIRDLRILESEL